MRASSPFVGVTIRKGSPQEEGDVLTTPDLTKQIRRTLERLAGQQAPLPSTIPEDAARLLDEGGSGIGLSQLNELLLLLGYDRVARGFFQYLVDGQVHREPSASPTIPTYQRLVEGVERFRQLALLLHGNVKYAFKMLSRNDQLLARDVRDNLPLDPGVFAQRHAEISPIQTIPPEKTYYLGYFVEREIRGRLEKGDLAARAEEEIRLAIHEIGVRNHGAYLVSDHLDVYVATSMRTKHDYLSVSRFVQQLFEQSSLKDLKLRYFDPTQAYCKSRVDKGLVEALMLRRAHCTIYLAQETDTLGKDSELASTLAQGKTVVAYVPQGGGDYAKKLVDDLQLETPRSSRASIILEQLKIFDTAAAWHDATLQRWISDPASMDEGAAMSLLREKIIKHYDGRADGLMNSHPLGIQVHLGTGVANGVLVVRTLEECAQLVRRIVTHALEFELKEEEGMVVLRERISQCIYRVMTQDAMLTNSFWNFYLNPV